MSAKSSLIENDKMGKTQQNVDEVCNIMRQNLEKVLERDANLSDLENQTEVLRDGSQRFEKNSARLRRKMWCHDKQICIWTIIVVTIVIIIIIVSVESNK